MTHSGPRLLAAALALVAAALLVPAGPARAADAPAAEAPAAPEAATGAYAVVVSQKTFADTAWRDVCLELVRRHRASIVTWETDVGEAQAALAQAMPAHACFVATPEEAGRDFVVAIHRLTRRLDDDPYTDCLWGILTGYDAADAQRVAAAAGPLVLWKALSGTSGGKLDAFAEAAVFDEGKAGRMTVKTPDGKTEEKGCPADSTGSIVDYLNREKPDAFITSGHATEHDWQIGYSYKGGQLRCKEGQLFGLDTQGQRLDVLSPNPKVFLPVGNCLIGHVPGRDCMVTAMIHSGGVVQMFGYVVPTWYGKGGWGIQDLVLGQPGRFTLAEAFYLNTQAMLHEIQTRFARSAGVDFDRYDLERRPRLIDELAARHNLKDRDELGLLWDRDTVAFYGDPAFEARPAPRPLAWEQTLRVDGRRYTLALATAQAGSWPERPVMMLLPRRVANVKVVAGEDRKPVVADNFILVPLAGRFGAGEKIEIVFEADPAGPPAKTALP